MPHYFCTPILGLSELCWGDGAKEEKEDIAHGVVGVLLSTGWRETETFSRTHILDRRFRVKIEESKRAHGHGETDGDGPKKRGQTNRQSQVDMQGHKRWKTNRNRRMDRK